MDKKILWAKIIATFSFFTLLVFATLDIFDLAWLTGFWIGKISFKWAMNFAAFEVLFLVALIGFIWILWFPQRTVFTKKAIISIREKAGMTRWIIAIGVALVYAWFFLFSAYGGLFISTALRLFLFLIVLGFIAIFFTVSEDVLIGWLELLSAGLVLGSVFAFAKLMVPVTDYPFSLSWSEGNRMWDYSLFFGRDRYIYPLDQPISSYTDQGRRSLYGLPMIIPTLTIGGLRLWNALMFSLLYAFLGWVLIKPRRKNIVSWTLFGLWTFLFLNQGPIWGPLVVAAIMVVAVRKANLWISIPVIFIAGSYAQSSRLTWMFAPAIWIFIVTLTQVRGKKMKSHPWIQTFWLTLAGLVGGLRFFNLFSSGGGDVHVSGADNGGLDVSQIGKSFDFIDAGLRGLARHDLIWSRLFPNATFSPGIILGFLVVVLPIIGFLIYLIRKADWSLNFIQQAGIGLSLFAFLAVGMTASVKAGGGTNLHNLDTFLVSVVMLAGLAFESGIDQKLGPLLKKSRWAVFLMILIVGVPAFTPVIRATPLKLPESENPDDVLNAIRNYSSCAQEYGDVLFMDQRQLLTFGFVENIPLIVEYEKKIVMDKALAADEEYLKKFYEELSAARFSLIISDPQIIIFKKDYESLADENNAWVKWVTLPILKHYESIHRFKQTNVQLLMPKNRDYECP